MIAVEIVIVAILWMSASKTPPTVAGVDDTTWDQIKKYIASVLSQLKIGNTTDDQDSIRVAAITYRDNATLNFDFKRYTTKKQLLDAVSNLPRQPGTLSNIGQALGVVETDLLSQCNERVGAACVVLAMLDNFADDPEVAERHESNFNIRGVQFLTVGLTSFVDSYNGLAALNTSYNRLYTDYSYLSDAVNDTIDLVCSHRPLFCNAVADIGFILDESTSILAAIGGIQNWYSILGFVEAVVSTMPIAPNLTRIGVSHFASTARVDFNFSTYTDSASLQRAVQKLAIQTGETNTADGFHVANKQLFPGRRPDVKTICIVITDGKPNINVADTYKRANETKALGIDVLAVGITNAVDVTLLAQHASSPDFVFLVTDYQSIEQIVGNLSALLCQEFLTTTTATTTTTAANAPPTANYYSLSAASSSSKPSTTNATSNSTYSTYFPLSKASSNTTTNAAISSAIPVPFSKSSSSSTTVSISSKLPTTTSSTTIHTVTESSNTVFPPQLLASSSTTAHAAISTTMVSDSRSSKTLNTTNTTTSSTGSTTVATLTLTPLISKAGAVASTTTDAFNLANSSSAVSFPIVLGVSPHFGIMAGGTKVTITGQHLVYDNSSLSSTGRKKRSDSILPSRPVAIRQVLLGNTPALVNQTSSLQDKLVIITQASAEIGSQTIWLQLINGRNISTDFSFDYHENPAITDFEPLTHLTIGGTQVNVTGTNINFVQNPAIFLTVVTTRYDSNSTVISRRQPTLEYESCVVVDATRMHCLMPPVDLDRDFNGDSVDSISENNAGSSSGSVSAFMGQNGRDRADVYIGLSLDGYNKYRNISETLPNVKMRFFTQPVVTCDTRNTQTYDEGSDSPVSIKGSQLTRGNRMVDVHVSVGDARGQVQRLTDNVIDYLPPRSKPGPGNGTQCSSDQLSVQINIGFAKYDCNCLQYTTYSPIDVASISGITVGTCGGVLLLALIIVVVVVRMRRSRTCRVSGLKPPTEQRPQSVAEPKSTPSVDAGYNESRYSLQSPGSDFESEYSTKFFETELCSDNNDYVIT